MNQVVAGVTALVLTIVLIGLGKRPRKLMLKSTDASKAYAVNQSQISLLQKRADTNQKQNTKLSNLQSSWKAPTTVQERIKLEKKLRQSMTEGPVERLEAITISGLWGHKNALPFLRQGLNDADIRVVRAAAAAISVHKGRPVAQTSRLQEGKPPRNVALMR